VPVDSTDGGVVDAAPRAFPHPLSDVAALPKPQPFTINHKWKKAPPILKLSICTGTRSVTITINDKVNEVMSKHHKPIHGYELFMSVADGNDSTWKKIKHIRPATCFIEFVLNVLILFVLLFISSINVHLVIESLKYKQFKNK